MLVGRSGLRARMSRSFALWRKVLGLLKYSSPKLGIVVLVVTVLETLLTIAALFSVKMVVDQIAERGGLDGGAAFRELLLAVALVLGLLLAARVMQAIGNYYRAAQGFLVSDYVNQAIQERAVAADLSFFDTALYYDNLERARQAGSQRPAQVIANTVNVFRGGMLLAGIVIVLVAVEWRLLPICLLAVGSMLAVQVRFTRMRFQLQRRLVQKERHAAYADWLMTSEPFAKEIRLWNLGDYLRDLYMSVRRQVRKDYLDIERRKSLSEAVISALGMLLILVVGAFILFRFSSGAAELSDLVIVILLLLRAEAAGREFVTSLSRLYDDQLFLDQLFVFLDLEPDMHAAEGHVPPPGKVADSVRLERVTFSYPGSDIPALRDVSMEIPYGRFTALVGGNGSGKTTLIKLLSRLYDPQEGRVTYGGTDVRAFDPIAYRRIFSVIFQDFVQFAYSGRDNIRLADLDHHGQEERMLDVARLTGAHEVLEPLPKGYDTILSRMFDGGVELSGGQWQKIALSRAMYPQSRFIILDEPTSAIDPNAEAELFEGFREKIGGRGALVISHRLSTVRQADYTYVLDSGRIVEEGTHDQLIVLGGRYAQMFERQGRGYRA